jgi:hypothetical protein
MGVMATGPGTGLATFLVRLFCRHEWDLEPQADTRKTGTGSKAPLAIGHRIDKYRCRKCGAVNVKRVPV